MSDDIVTRLRDYLAIVDHAFVWNELSEAADEIERLRAERDCWRNTCTRLVGKMLPFSLLMSEQEQEELQIILQEAVRGE